MNFSVGLPASLACAWAALMQARAAQAKQRENSSRRYRRAYRRERRRYALLAIEAGWAPLTVRRDLS